MPVTFDMIGQEVDKRRFFDGGSKVSGEEICLRGGARASASRQVYRGGQGGGEGGRAYHSDINVSVHAADALVAGRLHASFIRAEC